MTWIEYKHAIFLINGEVIKCYFRPYVSYHTIKLIKLGKIICYPDKFNQQGVFIRQRQDLNSVSVRTAFRVLYSIF